MGKHEHIEFHLDLALANRTTYLDIAQMRCKQNTTLTPLYQVVKQISIVQCQILRLYLSRPGIYLVQRCQTKVEKVPVTIPLSGPGLVSELTHSS